MSEEKEEDMKSVIKTGLKLINSHASIFLNNTIKLVNMNDTYNELTKEGVDPITAITATVGEAVTSSVVTTAGIIATEVSAVTGNIPGIAVGMGICSQSSAVSKAMKQAIVDFSDILCKFNKLTIEQDPPGCGWERGSFGEWYRRSGINVERYNNGSTTYVTKTDPFIPHLIKNEMRTMPGGVKLENENIIKLCQRIELDPNIEGDPISIVNGFLNYRGISYVVPNISDDELATAIFMVFFMKHESIEISLEPLSGDYNIADKIFNPSILSKTNLGRITMESDIIMKSITINSFLDLWEKETDRNGDDLKNYKCRDCFSFDEISYHREGNTMIFDENNIFIYTLLNKDSNILGLKNTSQFNERMAEYLAIHHEFRKIKAYMNLIFVCRLLYYASNSTVDISLLNFAKENMIILDDDYNMKLVSQTFSRKIDLGNGLKRCVDVKGGVVLFGLSLKMLSPWRIAVRDEDACDLCKFTIEPYMEKRLSSKGYICCDCCGERKKYELKFAGFAVTDRDLNTMTREDVIAIRNRVIAISSRKNQIDEITNNNASIAFITDRDIIVIVHFLIKKLGITGVKYALSLNNDDKIVEYKIVI